MSSFEVQLAIYDLSHGMARIISGQILGGPQYALDIVPHTGIVVHGKEYFYGGSPTHIGITKMDPQIFRAMMNVRPVQIISLGQTTVTQHAFESWCDAQQEPTNGRYCGYRYDLMQHNCNNFSNDAALQGLGLSRGVPQWILDVPSRVLASPTGQALIPMLQNMQMTPPATTTTATTTTTTVPPPPPPPRASAPPAVDPNLNPWAAMPSQSSTTQPKATEPQRESERKAAKEVSTPALDSYKRPLLSNDSNTTALCVKKLGNSPALQQVAQSLQTEKTIATIQLEAACKELMGSCFSTGKNVVFGLMLFRLLVLHHRGEQQKEAGGCLEWIRNQLTSSGAGLSPAARSMAWCAVSNAYAVSQDESLLALCETAIADATSTTHRAEVRQAAATLLYNVALFQKDSDDEDDDGVSDLVVSLLCSCLDGIAEETDKTTQLRRLLTVGKLLKPTDATTIKSARCNLVLDLGFDSVLENLVATNKDTKAVRADICRIMKQEA